VPSRFQAERGTVRRILSTWMTQIFADFQHDAGRDFDNRNDQKLGKNGSFF
jgi:hypothetical protein